jgi:phosphatidate phosphatase APP1
MSDRNTDPSATFSSTEESGTIAGLRGAIREKLRAATRAVTERVVGPNPYDIAAYRGFGTQERIFVHGRVLECKDIEPSLETHSRWRNLVGMYKRLESNPLPHAEVLVSVQGGSVTVKADREGFFGEWIDVPGLDAKLLWQPVELSLIRPVRDWQEPVKVDAEVLVPPASAKFAVVSDLDDTVIQSHITNFIAAVRTLLMGNARTRLPFPGVAGFYRALEHGKGGNDHNPVFYVSSGPWNLYDVISEFLELQRIPHGPLMLRNWNLSRDTLGSASHHRHKGTAIRQLLALYPELPFILIGDSGQHDPEIYSEIVHDHPDRILAVYIRNVSQHPERSAAIRKLAEEVVDAHASLVLADDTMAAAEHAAAHGWIAASALADVLGEKEADEGLTA